MKVLRVLLVEDMPDDADLILLEIERAHYHVISRRVANAEEFDHALDERWDVILSDFTMPQFDGKAALEILKARGLDVPFIIVSGSMGEDVAVEVMKAGAHDFFAKSRLKRLVSAIEREVREAEMRRERVTEKLKEEGERERLLGELQAAVRARDMFLSIASHELKTPLTSLLLHVQGLRRRDSLASVPVEKLDAKFERINRQVVRLTRLVDGLFDVVRITADKMLLSCESVDLAEVVIDVIRQAHENAQQHGAIIELATEAAVGFWDRLRIETVVSNLLSNAIKFGQGKPIQVSVRVEGELARLTVVDHGLGIPPEAQERIFEKFERAVPASHFGGFGLGLWIVRQILEAHGGGIRIDSRLGEGSTFVVDLPIVRDGADGGLA